MKWLWRLLQPVLKKTRLEMLVEMQIEILDDQCPCLFSNEPFEKRPVMTIEDFVLHSNDHFESNLLGNGLCYYGVPVRWGWVFLERTQIFINRTGSISRSLETTFTALPLESRRSLHCSHVLPCKRGESCGCSFFGAICIGGILNNTHVNTMSRTQHHYPAALAQQVVCVSG